jgi:hypothetical protein
MSQALIYNDLRQVESELKTCPVVENCCVYGDPSQSYVVALIVPDRVRLEQLAENLGISVSAAVFFSVFRIHVFFGLPDPLLRGMDPDPALDADPNPSIMQK